ncbi:MAG: hypothetical protein KGL67_01960 [Patescibacteria group bacterium]|nr:hypothetical protein [Patescibacteria group bacterium]
MKPTRDSVLSFISDWSGNSVESLLQKEQNPLGTALEEICTMCCLEFSRTFVVMNPKTFTLGELINQLIDDEYYSSAQRYRELVEMARLAEEKEIEESLWV